MDAQKIANRVVNGFMSRYEDGALPDPTTMCRGSCQGTGEVPVKNDDMSEPFHALWLKAEAKERSSDGWHFIICPECNGTGKRGNLKDTQKIADRVAKDMTSAVVYTLPFFSHGGNITNYTQLKAGVVKALRRERFEADILRRILNTLMLRAGEIAMGREIEISFNIPIFIHKEEDEDKIELQFQT